MSDKKQITAFRSENDLKQVLFVNYQKQIQNYFGDEKKALAFLSAVVAATQRTPDLLACTPDSVINSFMMMAQLGFMPSGVSGEAYVLPYNNSKKSGNGYIQVKEAQFQLGYQGLVTLFYRSGVSIKAAEIVYEYDPFSVVNGVISHSPDVFSDDRGEAKGAYVIVRLPNGEINSKVMSKKEILGMAEKFSKSFKAKHSPWDPANDPQLWMWKKTVLKQAAKLVPKNELIAVAVAEDNKDSIIADRLPDAVEGSKSLTMGALVKPLDEKTKQDAVGEEDQSKGKATDAEGDQSPAEGEEEYQIDDAEPPD